MPFFNDGCVFIRLRNYIASENVSASVRPAFVLCERDGKRAGERGRWKRALSEGETKRDRKEEKKKTKREI